MKLAPSVMRVFICVSRVFCSTDQEKRESARGLILEMPFGHHNERFSLSSGFQALDTLRLNENRIRDKR